MWLNKNIFCPMTMTFYCAVIDPAKLIMDQTLIALIKRSNLFDRTPIK